MSTEHKDPAKNSTNQGDSLVDSEIEAITTRLGGLSEMVALADLDTHYNLTRSSSGMSNYTDMLDDILDEYELEEDNEEVGKDYEKLAVRSYAQKTKKSHARGTPEYIELDDKALNRRVHFFRGKALNAKMVDPETGEQRDRTQQEKRDYVTKKFQGKTIYSDGVFHIKGDSDKREEVRNKIADYYSDVKDGTRKTKLFNSGSNFSAEVGVIMTIAGTKGNPVVATTKIPWVACEYDVGQMGGASGDGRETAFGYDESKKPTNRVLANNFIVSMTMREYRALKERNELVDVNVDIAKGTAVNRVIEEVTFNSAIAGELVVGSLPMVLPRFDREYSEMTNKKKAQYKRVFGLDEAKYEELKAGFGDSEVEIGKITRHLILHHGSLLRTIAVASDRRRGYESNFVVPYNTSYHGYVDDLNTPNGTKLDSRAARTGSARKTQEYMTADPLERLPEDPVKNLDAEFQQESTQEQTHQQRVVIRRTVAANGMIFEEFAKNTVDEEKKGAQR